ncbi:MAG TPA: GNAT family N-acetyltransferase [Mobilitalea sp.]|nr:GNAT family N-acetyltransferase [Mobilitalea sp.]
MIDEAIFEALEEKAEAFQYTSMRYTDFSEVSDYEIIYNNDKLILLYGYHPGKEMNEYHWASNSSEELLKAIDKKNRAYISFVPREWMEELKQFGFEVYAVFNDYVNPDIREVECMEEPELLTEDECEAASAVTVSCKDQSRGFHGETPEWMRSWIRGEEPSAVDTGTQNCAVIVHRENDRIVGVVCTATYAHQSEKGPITWVREVAVQPDFQKRGIARNLILQALSYGKAYGAVRAFLMADECNEHAIRLYERLGFIGNKAEAQIDMILV